MSALMLLLACPQALPRHEDFDFERHIRFLASREMKGRATGTEEGLKAAQYVADRFKECGLKPGGKPDYFHDFRTRDIEGRNVVGLLEGEIRGEYVVVAAHHDGRGIVDGKIQPGADDNASGVAMVMELARLFARTRPRRSMLFISFDAEERGLVGSREFLKSDLYETGSIVAMFDFDLIGGNFFEWEEGRIYALGAEYSDELSRRIRRHAADHSSGSGEAVWADICLIEPIPGMARSDYHAFRAKQIPFVFFSSGTPWYYHTEHDTIDVIRWNKMAFAGTFCYRTIAETVADPRRPSFRKPEPDLHDIQVIQDTLRQILQWREQLKDKMRLDEKQVAALKQQLEQVSAMKEPDVPRLQQAMALVFSIARAQGKK